MNRLALSGLLLTVAMAAQACTSTDADRQSLLASNSSWSVMTVGNLEQAGGSFHREQIRFSVLRRGSLYAEGRLYEAGPNDRPFNAQFPRVEWIDANILRMWYPPQQPMPSVSLRVHNSSPVALRWLRLRSDDLLLLLHVPPNGVVSMPFERRGDRVWFEVSGQFEDDSRVPEGTHVAPEGADALVLSISPEPRLKSR